MLVIFSYILRLNKWSCCFYIGLLILIWSDGEFNNTLALLDGNVISVQEITIESSLKASTKNLSEAVLSIKLVSVDPVQDIEKSIHSQRCNIVRSYVLNNSYLVEHDNLWDESNCLQPEAETPLKLEPPLVIWEWVVLCLIGCVANDCQHDGSWNERLEMRKVISKLIVGLHNI